MASVPTQMKAVQISKTGGIDVLDHTSVQVPSLGEGQILVKNEFAGINFIDTYFRTGLYKAPQFPLILGREGAGQVVSAHDSVANNASLKAGTKVVYMCGPDAGSYSEYTAVNARMAIPIPDGISTKTAAAALLQGLTAWTMIRESANVQAGQWTLVHAAAGGVGLLLCQMLKAVGAKVVGTASTDEKCALAKKNGAEWTVKSGDDLVSKAKEITGEHGFDAIFDGVGKTTFQADLEMIAMKGHLISFGNAVSHYRHETRRKNSLLQLTCQHTVGGCRSSQHLAIRTKECITLTSGSVWIHSGEGRL